MNNPRQIDKDLVEAQTARRIIDRLIGYKISPVLWSTLKKNMKFVSVNLSAGRVQSAALKIMIERERLRQAFNSATYYDIIASFKSGNTEFNALLSKIDNKRIAVGKDFDPNTGKLNNEDVILLSESQARTLIKELDNGNWTVTNVEEKIVNSNPKPPFTTSTLQQEAARKLRSSAKKTMRDAQQLYLSLIHI